MKSGLIKESGEIDFNFALQFTDLMAQLIAEATRRCLQKDVEMWLLTLKSLFTKARIFEKKAERIEEIDNILSKIEKLVNQKNLTGNTQQGLNRTMNEAYRLCFVAEEKILKLCDDNKLLIKRLKPRDIEALKQAMLE